VEKGRCLRLTSITGLCTPALKKTFLTFYALIELNEGPLISSNVIDIDPKDVKVGMPVEIVYEDHPGEGFTLPKFRPATT